MAVYQGKNTEPSKKDAKNLGLPAIIAAAVALVILLGWLYQKNFGPAPVPPPVGAAKTNHDYINGLYDRTGGSYDKLTDAEKQKINQMTMGHGQVAFQGIKN